MGSVRLGEVAHGHFVVFGATGLPKRIAGVIRDSPLWAPTWSWASDDVAFVL